MFSLGVIILENCNNFYFTLGKSLIVFFELKFWQKNSSFSPLLHKINLFIYLMLLPMHYFYSLLLQYFLFTTQTSISFLRIILLLCFLEEKFFTLIDNTLVTSYIFMFWHFHCTFLMFWFVTHNSALLTNLVII